MLCLRTTSPEQTQDVAQKIAPLLQIGDVVLLAGELGAGKTCFSQGVALGLGVEQRVTSPTFALANQYEGRLLLHHLDVYRLEGAGAALDLDLPELCESGVVLVEWGERIDAALPDERLVITMSYKADTSELSDSESDFFAEPVRILQLDFVGSLWRGRANLFDEALAEWIVSC